MSTPQENPATDPAQVPGAGAGTPAGEAPSGTPGQGSPPGKPNAEDPGDYKARIRSDHQFAISQVEDKERAVSRANQRVKDLEERFAALDPAVNQLGSAGAAYKHLVDYAQLRNNAAMMKVIDQFQNTGRVPTEGNQEEGLYQEEPEVSQVQAELEQLRQKVTMLEGGLTQTQVNTSKQVVVEFLKDMQAQYPQDIYDDIIRPGLEKQVGQWENDPSGRQILSSLNPGTLRTVVGSLLMEDNALESLGEAVYRRKQQQLTEQSTGPAPAALSTGTPQPPGQRPSSVREAFAEADRLAETGALPEKYRHF